MPKAKGSTPTAMVSPRRGWHSKLGRPPGKKTKKAAKFSPKVTRQSLKKKDEVKVKKPKMKKSIAKNLVTHKPLGPKKKELLSQKTVLVLHKPSPPRPPTFDSFLLQNMSAKQQAGLTKDLRERINKVGNSILALTLAKRELIETDAKVAQLEETYGRTMKLQDVWQYQERAGLAAIIGQDPQAVMNAPHIFKNEERLMYNSAYPRSPRSVKKESPAQSSPTRREPRTRAQLHAVKERFSTDDED